MMNNKKPPELHLIDGTKGMNMGTLFPESIKQRIPKAEWLDNPESWNQTKFIEETSDFLFEVYGMGSKQDKHSLSFLADTITLYIDCKIEVAKSSIIIETNAGKTLMPNPYISIQQKCLRDIFMIMNELGLTPRGRLNKQNSDKSSAVSKFLRGPKG